MGDGFRGPAGSVSHDAISLVPGTLEKVATPTAEANNINDDDDDDDDDVRHRLKSLDVDVEKDNGSAIDVVERNCPTIDMVGAAHLAALIAAVIPMVVIIYGGECVFSRWMRIKNKKICQSSDNFGATCCARCAQTQIVFYLLR